MRFINYHKTDGGFWFRIFGYGLVFNDRDKHYPLFSVRQGIKKELRLGKWGIQTLKP